MQTTQDLELLMGFLKVQHFRGISMILISVEISEGFQARYTTFHELWHHHCIIIAYFI